VYDVLSAHADGVYLARDLINEPPNTLYPESYAQRIKDELKPLGVDVDVIDDKKMEKLGMGAALAVGKGSERKPRIVVMTWNGAGNDSDPVGLVGKGVTFDTGGISIKPSNGMHEMKFDMGGSAAVVGAMKTLATRKAKSNVVAVVGLAENMPSHNAYRPGDIIKSMSGKTVEILNTDAEGRLVLADCLTYIQKEYNPKCIIDLATLTGAIMVGLGQEYAGAFVNDDKLWSALDDAAKLTNEKLWRMPLDKAYSKDMKSKMADYNNLGGVSRYGGACTAAAFLEFFVDKDRDWAHLDIAGVAWNSRGKPLADKDTALGYWVRTLDRFVNDYAEG
jgi:leucyl aminopeptidase